MTNWRKKTIVMGAAAAVLAISAGVAVAGGALGSDKEHEAFLSDAAKRLDVTPAELKAALQGAHEARIDAAVAAGKLTKEQGEALKQRAKDGGLPRFGGGHHGGFGGGGDGHRGGPGGRRGPSLDAAATYLGLTQAQLRAELEAGKTLAQIAKAKGKSVDGLKVALKAGVEKKLDAAVKAGRLTRAQADEMLSMMSDHLDALINGTLGRGHHRGSGPEEPRPGASAPAASLVPAASVA